MLMLVFAILLQGGASDAAPGQTPPPPAAGLSLRHDGPGDGTRPQADGNEAEWVTTDDYPAQALREGRYGTSGTELQIGRDGRVRSCIIVASSGSADLDAVACARLTARARFRPARDRRGRAVEGTFNRRVVWMIPDTGRVIEPAGGFRSVHGIIARFHVTQTGSIDVCHVLNANASSTPVSSADESSICARIGRQAAGSAATNLPAEGLWFEQRDITYSYLMDPHWDGPDSAAGTPTPTTPPTADPLPSGVT